LTAYALVASAAIATTSVSPLTRTGTRDSAAVVPFPSLPSVLLPHADTEPSLVSA
jgi:hypothetical protein